MKHFTIATVMIVAATFTLPVHAAEEEEIEFLEKIEGYLDVSEKYVALAKSKENAIFFAIEGIVEIHEERGEQAKAIPALQKILEKNPENQAVRNIVRFKLRDVYVETGRADLGLAELEAVIEENR